VVLSVFGGLVGYQLSKELGPWENLMPFFTPVTKVWALTVLGIMIGVVAAPWLGAQFMRLINWVVESLQRVTIQEILMGAAGFILGLIIATLINVTLGFIPFSSVPVLGPFLQPFIGIIMILFWGYLGVYLGIRIASVRTSGQLFDPSARQLSFLGERNFKVLDTSAIVDGRIADICQSGFLDGTLVVPQFVLDELQHLADCPENLKRNRGRRGLDILNKLRKERDLQVVEKEYPEPQVDTKLVRLAQELKASLITTDFNLNKVAQVQGVKVLNVNDLANAVKSVVLAGEEMNVQILREGKEPNQGLGYLDDGTMVVVEGGRKFIGAKVAVEVTSVLQTSAGKMLFVKIKS